MKEKILVKSQKITIEKNLNKTCKTDKNMDCGDTPIEIIDPDFVKQLRESQKARQNCWQHLKTQEGKE